MASNILKKGNDARIIISYSLSGRPVRYDVSVRYSDDNETYFAMPLPINFIKPKNNTDVSITYRSSLGVLYAKTKTVSCNMSLQEIIFAVKTPTIWEDKEARRSRRKEYKIPVTIEYDGNEYKTESYDLSTGGISVLAKWDLSNTQLPANIIMEFDSENIVTVQGKYIREKEVFDERNLHLYVYKFTGVSGLATMMIKKYLLGAD